MHLQSLYRMASTSTHETVYSFPTVAPGKKRKATEHKAWFRDDYEESSVPWRKKQMRGPTLGLVGVNVAGDGTGEGA